MAVKVDCYVVQLWCIPLWCDLKKLFFFDECINFFLYAAARLIAPPKKPSNIGYKLWVGMNIMKNCLASIFFFIRSVRIFIPILLHITKSMNLTEFPSVKGLHRLDIVLPVL